MKKKASKPKGGYTKRRLKLLAERERRATKKRQGDDMLPQIGSEIIICGEVHKVIGASCVKWEDGSLKILATLRDSSGLLRLGCITPEQAKATPPK